MNVEVLEHLDGAGLDRLEFSELNTEFRSPRLCLCGCGQALESRPGRGRPVAYASEDCRRKADNQRDRDRRAGERSTLDGFISRAARSGRLEHKQPPSTELPDDYWTLLALAYEVDLFHGPAADSPDDPRLPAFTAGVCRIISQATRPPRPILLELDDSMRMSVTAVDDQAQDHLARLFEMRDRLRTRPSWTARAAWDDRQNAVAAVDLYGNPVTIYVPPGPQYRTAVPVRNDAYGTCQEFYSRDPRQPYRATPET
jgi:hypothetical protein